MQFRILGEVNLDTGAGERVPGGRLGQIFLGVLLSRPDQRVSVDTLSAAMWPNGLDRDVVHRLQLHASRVRALLDDGDRLDFELCGYRLRIAPDELDALRFEQLASRARSTTEPEHRSKLAAEALRLWRGIPYGGLDVPVLDQEARRLEECRLDLLELHFAAEIACGRQDLVVGELAELAKQHPLREHLQTELVDALHRAGRPAEALQAYQAARTALVDQLGLEPGAELVAVQQRVLSGQAPPSVDTGEEWKAPHRLPIAPLRFTGRVAELADLDSLLRQTSAGTGTLIVLHGPGGVGKSSLALRWAHQVADQFGDGQLAVNLRGHGPTEPLTPAAALTVLLGQLGIEPGQIPAAEQDRRTLLLDLIANRRLLILLDNARDSAQIRPLLPGGEHVVLVTSRSQLRSLVTHEGARRVAVRPMNSDEAVELLADRLAGHPSQATEGYAADLAELASLCGHLPIALAVVAERAGRHERLPLAELAVHLRGDADPADRLTSLTAWEDDPTTSVREVVSWSYQALDPATARLFRLLGLHPHPSLDAHAAGWLAGTTEGETGRALDRLVDAHLLTETSPGEFELHDLVRALAAELAAEPRREAERELAVTSLRSGYLHTLAAARAASARPHPWLALGRPDNRVRPRLFATATEVFPWYREQFGSVLSCLQDAFDSGDHRWVFQATALLDVVLRTRSATEHEQVCATALASATASADPVALIHAHSARAVLLARRGAYEEALAELDRATDVSDRPDAVQGASIALRRGVILGLLGRHAESVLCQEEALQANLRAGLTPAPPLNNLAVAHLKAGQLEQARDRAEQAVAAYRADASPLPVATGLDTLGRVQLAVGDPAAARDSFAQAVQLRRDAHAACGDSAEVLRGLGLAERDLGHFDLAAEAWREALRDVQVVGEDVPEVNRRELQDLIRSVRTV